MTQGWGMCIPEDRREPREPFEQVCGECPEWERCREDCPCGWCRRGETFTEENEGCVRWRRTL